MGLSLINSWELNVFRLLWYCFTWSQFKRENEWIPKTDTRIQDIVGHRITQSHDTFQVRV
ncbi:hypothetical protein DPMN_008791 [Dreissena polymorpha]|uniref:Uncharacterized protein n=1 Tax=Dreissena polymorpha TaxID=45954 RepID=A0A9D4RXD1_DREPO|nr:hypothetical protein DPMN_008791 [Dreissena polymorpha]